MSTGVAPLRRLLDEREGARAQLRRPAGIGALILVIVLAVISVIWAINNPRAFPEPRGQVEVNHALHVAQPYSVAMLPVDARKGTTTVHLESVRANLVENSAHADLTFFVCTMAYPRKIARLMPLLTDLCTSVVPVSGVDLTIGPEAAQQLLMTVTAQQAGVVSVQGVDITYSYSWRHGTQRSGKSVRLHFG